MREFVEDKDVQLKFKDVCLSRSIISLPGAISGDIITLLLCTLYYYSQYPRDIIYKVNSYRRATMSWQLCMRAGIIKIYINGSKQLAKSHDLAESDQDIATFNLYTYTLAVYLAFLHT